MSQNNIYVIICYIILIILLLLVYNKIKYIRRRVKWIEENKK